MTIPTRALLLLLSLAAVTIGGSAPPFGAESTPAGQLPLFAMRDAQGNVARLDDFRGKVLVLNVWATWCAPCRRELPSLVRLGGALDGRTFAIAALSIDRDALAAREYLTQRAIDITNYLPEQREQAMQALDIAQVPTTLVIAADGRVVARVVGPREWDSDPLVEQLNAMRMNSEAAR